ncbi:MAG: hypothetical protein QY326_03365 [Bdellovibrionota bacterium]|nr:MAG: hypothetical protein QY326_03365 [Bdellovibrionota bacterium]
MPPEIMRTWDEVGIISIPDWVIANQHKFQSRKYQDSISRMDFVLELARNNAQQQVGAPLAAAVFHADGDLISVGVDAPGIGGHEMTNALILASNILGSVRLRNSRDWELYSLAPPCSVCLGNIYSERPQRFASAVTHEDLLAALALPDTPMPGPNWIDELTNRDIIVNAAIRRDEGRKILRRA